MENSIQAINKLILAGETDEALKLLHDRKKVLPGIIFRQKLEEIRITQRPSTWHANAKMSTLDNTSQIKDCLLDISDLINFLVDGHSTLSGIQRLIVATLCELSQEERHRNKLVTFNNFLADGGRIVTWDVFDLIVDLVTGRIADKTFHQAFRLEVEKLPLLAEAPGSETWSTLLIMGACWIVPDFPYAQKTVAHERRLKIISILYDLIPFARPEYVSADGVSEFYMYIISLLAISSKVITISRHVERELKKSAPFFQGHVPVIPDIEAVPLARQIPLPNVIKEESNSHDVVKHRLEKLEVSGEFVLCVGSIEIRKNHIGLFVAWRKLYGILGTKCPLLVIVGRKGWKAEAFFDSLNATNNLDQKILILNGLGDTDLALLYRECLFTVYPSLDEGWGLPIGESLDSGKVCVTSALASMPEVGEDLCLYVNPHEPDDIASKCLQLIEGRKDLKEMESKILNAKPFKSWLDYKNDLALCINSTDSALGPEDDATISNILIRLAEPVCFYWHLGYPLSSHSCALKETKRSLSLIVSSKLARDSSALSADPDGTWIADDKLDISFVLKLEGEVLKSIYLDGFLSRRKFELLIHFYQHPDFCKDWRPSCEMKYGSPLSLLKPKSLAIPSRELNIASTRITMKTSNLLSINTELLLSKPKVQEYSGSVEKAVPLNVMYLPVKFSLSGLNGARAEKEVGYPREGSLKIQELAIFSR